MSRQLEEALKRVDAESRRPIIDSVVQRIHESITKQPIELLAFGHFTSDEMANKVRMLTRDSLMHESVCVGARDRIVWLAARYEEAIAQCTEHQRDLHEANMEIIRLKNLLRPVKPSIGEPPGPEEAV